MTAPWLLTACRDDAHSTDVDIETAPAASAAAAPETSQAALRPALPRSEPVIRVRIERVRGRGGVARVGGEGQWVRAALVDAPQDAVVLKGPIDARAVLEGWALHDGAGLPAMLPGGVDLEMTSIDPREPHLELNGRKHPGAARLVRRSEAGEETFDVVNHVPLEAYLPGVVAGELFAHWEPSTFMAQAVAARSFAAAEHAHFASRRHFDLTNTAQSQVYGGTAAHHRAIDAVAMTRGEMLSYQERLVPGYYSSCCGGVSAAAVDAISINPVNDVAPLRGRGREDACRDAPVFSWTIERPVEAVTRRLVAFGQESRRSDLADLARVRAIEVAESSAHGRPRTFVVHDVSGAAVLVSARDLRQAMNATLPGLSPPRHRLKSANFTARVDVETIVFSGYGFGHGAGLCQYGAQSLARDGRGYREIMEWYFPGAGVVRGYG